MSKYIIEIAKEYKEYFKGVLICGIADEKFAVDIIAREDLEELNSDYINEHFGELQDEAYQAGLNDAWEATKKIFGYEIDGAIPIADIGNVFGYEPCKAFCTADILRDFTVQEAIDKIKAYEDKHSDRIEVGDEVNWDGVCFIVTKIFQPRNMKEQCDGIDDDGSVYHDILMEDLTKTGKHYDIQSILEAMRE